MSDPDPAAIMAQHERHWQSHGSPICLGGREYAEDPELPDVSRCLIYQLAEALAEAQERERRVRALALEARRGYHPVSSVSAYSILAILD